MSILTENSKKMLVESMRECLSEVLHESTSLTSKQATEKIKFVTESATYEQLLNITLNPHRQEKYQPAYVLEGAVAILHSACMTGRKHIGINAITEGALKLQKKTGAVITESMLDAALLAVTEGAGLKVVGKILTEANEWDAVLRLIADPAERTYVQTQLAQVKNGLIPSLDTRSIGILRGASGGAGKNLDRLIANMNDPNWIRRSNLLDQVKSEITPLIAKQKTTGLTPAENARLTQLLGHRRALAASVGKNAASAGAGKIGNLGNSAVGAASKGGWGKYALGAAAIGGLGALGYQYYKNRKAMNRDIQNGIE